MSRKHYKLLADALASTRPHLRLENQTTLDQWSRVVVAIARECRGDNYRFAYDTFYAACGLTEYQEYLKQIESGEALAGELIGGVQ